jgi:AraC-like DNA-binding protein
MTVPSRSMLSVTTMLTPNERLRVDAAGEGSYRALHRDGVGDVIRDLKDRRADAVLLSAACCEAPVRPAIRSLVREFPRVPTVALLSEQRGVTPQALVALGGSGVQLLVDVRDPAGWRELRRTLLARHGTGIEREALAQLALDLAGAHDECWRFFETLFTVPARVSTVRALARELTVLSSTLMSRFFRAQLPPPKRYLAMARLVRAARLFENPGFSIANVANHLDYSSPQSFGRHVRALLGVTATEFRDRHTGAVMLAHFRDTLILPHVDRLRVLRPLSSPAAALSAQTGPSRLH